MDLAAARGICVSQTHLVNLQGPVMVGSSQGGMNIEEVAVEMPSAIIKEPINVISGLKREQAVTMAAEMGFDPQCIDQVWL